MNCTSCHDSFAPLNFPAGIKTTRDLNALKLRQPIAQSYVESGEMPPGNKLTPEERKALWRCLSSEYYDPGTRSGLLVDWLREH